ncbi:MAG: hypothetical protein R2736_07460 [Solirubrobacterales bacterium]
MTVPIPPMTAITIMLTVHCRLNIDSGLIEICCSASSAPTNPVQKALIASVAIFRRPAAMPARTAALSSSRTACTRSPHRVRVIAQAMAVGSRTDASASSNSVSWLGSASNGRLSPWLAPVYSQLTIQASAASETASEPTEKYTPRSRKSARPTTTARAAAISPAAGSTTASGRPVRMSRTDAP